MKPIELLVSAVATFALATFATWWTTDTYWRGELARTELTYANERRTNAEVAARKLAASHERARQIEATATAEYQRLSKAFLQERQDDRQKLEKLGADLRADVRRLSIPVATDDRGHSGLSDATGPADRGDDAARARLSGSAADFLVGLAGDADDITRQLRLCQSVVAADRAAVNPSPLNPHAP
ncbi:lysis protein [Burkholderia dolosa]|uniref:lysis system i-spanin subunit Rz n=1 Tax=Burkholderia dolosa TaxID=152500 RepID=UPI001B8F42EB|nr:lysis system i-spanin subunit Rz [Burkholderia dolosa]MBR8314666.1 lysis protein [Burkholderia dolosa]